MSVSMQKRIKKIRRLINARALRERFFLLLTLIAAIYFLFDALLFYPTQNKIKNRASTVAELDEKIAKQESQINQIIDTYNNSPIVRKQRESALLEKQSAELKGKLDNITTDFIPAKYMAQVLQDIIGKTENVELSGLENLPSMPVLEDTKDNEAKLYKHGLQIKLTGNYEDVMGFLRRIERLTWKIHWQSMEYQVTKYPEAKVTIVMYTMSTQENWLGV